MLLNLFGLSWTIWVHDFHACPWILMGCHECSWMVWIDTMHIPNSQSPKLVPLSPKWSQSPKIIEPMSGSDPKLESPTLISNVLKRLPEWCQSETRIHSQCSKSSLEFHGYPGTSMDANACPSIFIESHRCSSRSSDHGYSWSEDVHRTKDTQEDIMYTCRHPGNMDPQIWIWCRNGNRNILVEEAPLNENKHRIKLC